MATGFDKNAKPVKREKSAGQLEREKMGNKYDEIASAGGQEYSIFVRQFGGEAAELDVTKRITRGRS